MVRRKKRSWWNLIGHVKSLAHTREGRGQLGIYAGLILFGFAVFGIVDRTIFSPDEITPSKDRIPGWDAKRALEVGPAIARSQPSFAIRDENGAIVSSRGSYNEIWKFEKLVNGGKFLLLPPQQTGDCASYAGAQGLTRRHAAQIYESKSGEKLLSPSTMALYGLGRHQVGKDRFRGRPLRRGGYELSPGCTVGEILQAAQGYGLYSLEQAEKDGFPYSGNLANVWGDTGPPKKVLDAARKVRLRAFSAMRTWDDVVDALANNYPIPFGAPMVFRSDTKTADGKRWLQFDSSVPPRNRGHAQVLIGVEDRPGKKAGAYCLGSWGVDAHDKPLNGEPPGGGWVEKELIEQIILPAYDCYAISDSDTFEVDKNPASVDVADWNAFALEDIDEHEVARQLGVVDRQEDKPVLLETRKMFSLPLLFLVLVIGIALFAGGLMAKYGLSKSAGTVGAILIAATFLGAAERADAGYRKRLARQQQQFAATCGCPNGACAAGQCVANCPNGQCATACVNGRCPTGYVPPKGKATSPAAGLPAEMKPAPKVTPPPAAKPPNVASDFSDCPASAFNAFEPQATAQVWTMFPANGKALRTYADCYRNEPDFVLVIGAESDALMTLEIADKPVAHELTHTSIKPGAHHVYEQSGRKMIEPLVGHVAMSSATVRVRSPDQ